MVTAVGRGKESSWGLLLSFLLTLGELAWLSEAQFLHLYNKAVVMRQDFSLFLGKSSAANSSEERECGADCGLGHRVQQLRN